MDTPETKAILDTQDTPRRQTKHKNTSQGWKSGGESKFSRMV